MKVFKSLQALSYWYGYQTERYPHLELREIAIAHELAALMLGAPLDKLRVELERKYKDLPLKAGNSIAEVKKSLLDLYVDFIDSNGVRQRNCIEIKRLSSGVSQIESDIDKLSSLKKSTGLHAWVIVCGQGKLPASKSNPVWSKNGKFEIAKGSAEPIKTKNGSIYCVRRIIKASSTRAKDGCFHNSNYVVLLEVKL